MKAKPAILLLICLLAACATSEDAMETASVVPPSTVSASTERSTSLAPTSTNVAAAIEPSPTPKAIEFTRGFVMPDKALFVPRDKILDIVSRVEKEPSLLAPDASPAKPTQILTNTSTGEAHFTLECPVGSCAIAATIKTSEQDHEPVIFVWEIKMANGKRGYFLDLAWEPSDHNGGKDLQRIAANLGGATNRVYIVRYTNTGLSDHPYLMYIMQRQGYEQFLREWVETGVLSPELRNMVIMGSGN
jgi:hypothetical protein